MKAYGAGPLIGLGKGGQTPPAPEVAKFATFAFLAVYVCGRAGGRAVGFFATYAGSPHGIKGTPPHEKYKKERFQKIT